jgi:hypothetical protein
VLLLPERSLGDDALRDVDRVPEDVRVSSRLFEEHIAVHPHALASIAGDHAHQPGILTVVAHPLQVAAEEVAGLGREKFREVATNSLLRLIA